MIYTDNEVSNKKYLVKDAVNAAKFIIYDKTGERRSVKCARSMDEKITLKELNEICDDLIYENM